MIRGSTSFAWLGDGFIVQRSTVDVPEAPDGVAIYGVDGAGGLVQHLFDSRGVTRLYRTSLRDGVWKVWRDGPGFAQRFAGAVSDDGRTIAGTFENSPDGWIWERDFDIVYTRVG